MKVVSGTRGLINPTNQANEAILQSWASPMGKKFFAIVLSLLLMASWFMFLPQPKAHAASVITYPAPAGTATNSSYTVTVEGSPVFVYDTIVGLALKHAGFAYFDFSGTVNVTVTTNFDISSVQIRPLALGITPTVSGRTISFSLSNPANLSIEFNGDIDTGLMLFANPPEVSPPSASDPNVIYYGPGVYTLTGTLYVPSNKTVYIAGGAIVKGRIHTDGVSNVTIRGRGILSGDSVVRSDFGGDPRSYFMRFLHSTNVNVEGIILTNSPHWTIVPTESDTINITNVKLVGQHKGNNDGIDIVDSRNVMIDRIFIRTVDDCIALKGKYIGGQRGETANVTIQNSTVWNDDSGNGLEIGYELLTANVKNIIFRNIDMIHNRANNTISIHDGDSAKISNVLYDNIRIEDSHSGGRFLDVFVNSSYYSMDEDRGSIENVTFNNINYMPAVKGSSLAGHNAAHMVKNISFNNVKMGGTTITSAAAMSLSSNTNVSNVTFSSSPVTVTFPSYTPQPGTPVAVLLQAERIGVSGASSGNTTIGVDAYYLETNLDAVGDWVEYKVFAPFTMDYTLIPRLITGPARGIYQVYVDGTAVGSPIDAYSSDVGGKEVYLGPLPLTKDVTRTVRFQVTGKNSASTDYSIGMDYLKLLPNTAFLPTNDATVRDGGSAGTNYGAEDNLTVKSDVSGYSRKAYVKFNIGTYTASSTASAKLRVRVSEVNTSPTRTVKVYGTAIDSWNESLLTWSTAPAGTDYIGSLVINNSSGEWYDIDVTAYLNSQLASSDRQISFLLVNEGAVDSLGNVSFFSKDKLTDAPRLILN